MAIGIAAYVAIGVCLVLARLFSPVYIDGLRADRVEDAACRAAERRRPLSDTEWCAWEVLRILFVAVTWPISVLVAVSVGRH